VCINLQGRSYRTSPDRLSDQPVDLGDQIEANIQELGRFVVVRNLNGRLSWDNMAIIRPQLQKGRVLFSWVHLLIIFEIYSPKYIGRVYETKSILIKLI